MLAELDQVVVELRPVVDAEVPMHDSDRDAMLGGGRRRLPGKASLSLDLPEAERREAGRKPDAERQQGARAVDEEEKRGRDEEDRVRGLDRQRVADGETGADRPEPAPVVQGSQTEIGADDECDHRREVRHGAQP